MSSRTYAAIAFTALLSLSIMSVGFILFGGLLHSTESPNKQYRAEITQSRFLLERAVYLNAYRNDEQIVRRKLLYTGDFMDDDFKDLYPEYSWASESILRIGRNVYDAGNQFGSMRVVNESPNRISYLLIETFDNKVVLFDVEPGASIDVGFPFFGWLSCQGEFAESKGRFGSGAGMPQGERLNQIEVKIRGGEVNIESPQVKLERRNCCAPDRPDFQHELSY